MLSSVLTLVILSASRLCCRCTTNAFTPSIGRGHERKHRLQCGHRQQQQSQKETLKHQDSILTTTGLQMAKSGSLGCRPIGIGSAAPSTIVTNVDLEAVVETSDEWICSRTGISRRHLLLEHECLSDLAIRAGRSALDMAKIDPTQIDLVVCATSTPDDLFGDAGAVAAALGCKEAMAFDVTAACSGFLFGIVTAGQFLSNPNGSVKNALVIGADALSRWVDWDDRNSCILFGDGAGAMVLTQDLETSGVLGYAAHSNGDGHEDLTLS
jgi:3-oxoacyl-[acyl-carrier-protein] synthase-3